MLSQVELSSRVVESSYWVKLLNSIQVLKFNFSTQLNTFSKKFQLNSTLFESSTWFELKYSTWRDQSTIYIIHIKKTEDASLITQWSILYYIIMNARLKLLLELNTITQKTHNQLTTINLVFDSEKIQFIIYKCKVRIDLH